jgi:SAM-dependent methyltransferase
VPNVARFTSILILKRNAIMTETLEDVAKVRVEFDFNVGFVKQYLSGRGYDFGCGSAPLLGFDCFHFDISPQPLAVQQVGKRFIQADCFNDRFADGVDFIFSSHMVEDLPSRAHIIACLNGWSDLLVKGGYLVLLLPDMQGGRYPTVAEGGNPSHRVDVGAGFINENLPELELLELVQLDTIPHDKSCTIDVVMKRVK